MRATIYLMTAALLMIAGLATTTLAASDEQSTTQALHSTSPAPREVHAAGLCRFHIDSMFGGYYDDPQPGDSPPQGFYHMPDSGPDHSSVLYGGFGLYCIAIGDGRLIDTYLGAKQVDGRWLQPGADDAWVPFDRAQEFETIEFSGPNWIGHGTLVDDTTGDERKRARWFRFCLTHGSLALCGNTPVEYLVRKNINELPKMKAILQSIEFVDDRPAKNPAESVKGGGGG